MSNDNYKRSSSRTANIWFVLIVIAIAFLAIGYLTFEYNNLVSSGHVDRLEQTNPRGVKYG